MKVACIRTQEVAYLIFSLNRINKRPLLKTMREFPADVNDAIKSGSWYGWKRRHFRHKSKDPSITYLVSEENYQQSTGFNQPYDSSAHNLFF